MTIGQGKQVRKEPMGQDTVNNGGEKYFGHGEREEGKEKEWPYGPLG